MKFRISSAGRAFWVLLAMLFVLFALNIWLLFLHQSEIVYVDGARILQEYKGGNNGKEAFEHKVEQWKKNIDTLQAAFDAAYLDFELEEKQLTASARDVKKSALTKQRRQLEDYKAAIEQNAASENTKITQENLVKINKFLSEYGKKQRYKFILIANQVGTIAYAEEGLDKTDEVLKALNNVE